MLTLKIYDMKKFFLPIGLLLLFVISANAQQVNNCTLISLNKEGKLQYNSYTSKGDILPDFSYCGYKRGEADFPKVENKIILYPDKSFEDDTQRIQQALDSVSCMKKDKSGMRGAVLLKKGKYNLASTLFLNKSGVVLRGESCDEDGTTLVATTPKQYTLIQVGTSSKAKKKGCSYSIVDKYVPSGSRVIHIEKNNNLKKGDHIIVERIGNSTWIKRMGMDRIAPRWVSTTSLSPQEIEEYRKKGKLSTDGKKYDATVQWEAGSKNICFERTIVDVSDKETFNEVILDIPLTTAFQKEYGGGVVYKYEYKDRPENIGIENLRGISLFDKRKVACLPYLKNYFADEKHGWTFLSMNACENIWVQKLVCEVFSLGYMMNSNCKNATIKNCSFLDPVSIIDGGRRYGFCFAGQLCLVQQCYSRNGRHDFVLGATVAGPNAFVECKAELAHAASEPHQRWATGCLWDNCEVTGPMGYFSISNRGNYGTGHGWAGAQMVMWNCKADLAVLMSPPTAENFAIGTKASQSKWASHENLKTLVERLNKVSGKNFRYEGFPVVGDGIIELQNKTAEPKSLYYKQLEDRINKTIDNSLE